MSSTLEKLQVNQRAFLTADEVESLLGGTPDSRYSRIRRLIAQGKLLHIKRGIYSLPNPAGCFAKLHPFELAQFIYGPSYISLESALSYHKLIPETVYTITSATGKRSKESSDIFFCFAPVYIINFGFYFF